MTISRIKSGLGLAPAIIFSFLVIYCSELPFADSPNHLARAVIINDLLQNGLYKDLYSFQAVFAPYILGDLYLCLLLKLFSPLVALKVYLLSTFWGLQLATAFFLKLFSVSIKPGPTFWLLNFYVGTNYFFLSGYHSFYLSVCLCFWGICIWKVYQDSRLFPKLALAYLSLGILIALTYLSHLGGFFFLSLFISSLSVYELFSTKTIKPKACFSLFPICLLWLLHFNASMLGSGGEHWTYRTGTSKLIGLAAGVIRYDFSIDLILLVLFGSIIITRLRANQSKCNRQILVLVLACLLAYLALPAAMGPATQVDSRATLFLTILLLPLSEKSRDSKISLVLAFILALTNLAALSYRYIGEQERLAALRLSLSKVPSGQRLLNIYTWSPTGRIDTGIHYSGLYSIYATGFSQGIFNELIAPGEFPYFSQLKQHYAPSSFWYVRNLDKEVNWEILEKTYDYLLITKPFEETRLHLDNKTTVYENDHSAILRIGN